MERCCTKRTTQLFYRKIEIMKVFVINLKRRPDRLQEITKECEKHSLPFELIEAIDGHVAFPNAPRRIMQGALGCQASHIKALKEALKYDEHCLILEDDCQFTDNLSPLFSSFFEDLPANWDVFFLGGSLLWKDAISDFKPNLKRANNVLCTHAYMVNRNSIEKLLSCFESRKFKVDVLFTEFQKENNCFIAYPELATQRKGYSDIVDAVTDNVHLKYGKNGNL